MARLVYGLNVTLDGYADHDAFGGAPATLLFRHFIEQVRGFSGMRPRHVRRDAHLG